VSQPARRADAGRPAPGQPIAGIAKEPPGPSESPLISLEEIQHDALVSTFISGADRVMEGLGYTEHGFRHANLTARIAFNVLSRLGKGDRVAALACLAGYLHDVGNMVARENHGATGALLAYDALKDRMSMSDLSLIMGAVGNHEEEGGEAISAVSAAVILADKSDVHRTRVRKSAQIDFDIHDRVNYAAEQSFLRVDSSAATITLELTIDTEISDVMEYFEIFLHRMMMCRRAAEQLDCRFKLTINGANIL
jgi:metal-dependent HD superfamily phosphatase/phosphodiesterase